MQTSHNISDYVKKHFPDLIPLILESESMPDHERQYWFDMLPVMSAPQIQRLRDILLNEKKQLAALDAEYKSTMADLAGKDISKRSLFPKKRKEQRSKLVSSEAAQQAEEKAREIELLKKLEDI